MLLVYYIAVCNSQYLLRNREEVLKGDENVTSAYPTLYLAIAGCYDEKNDSKNAAKYYEQFRSYEGRPSDTGPFYHGTKANLDVGDLLKADKKSNYDEKVERNHIYFTANFEGAALATALAQGEGEEHVYRVESLGDFEDDPNVTDKKFPGNLTRSYRSLKPLRMEEDMINWKGLSESEREDWNKRLAKIKGKLIN